MSTNIIKGLLEERANVLEQARALNETAEKEGRDLTADAQQTWDGHMEAIRALDLRLAEVNDLDQRNAKAEEMRARYEAVASAASTKVEPDLTDDEKRELLRIARATLREHCFSGRIPPGKPHRESLVAPAAVFAITLL